MSYFQEIQVLLAKYPEIKSIRVVREEQIERETRPPHVPVPATVPSKVVARPDLFELEPAPKAFPTVEKKKLDPKSEAALKAAMIELNQPPV